MPTGYVLIANIMKEWQQNEDNSVLTDSERKELAELECFILWFDGCSDNEDEEEIYEMGLFS